MRGLRPRPEAPIVEEGIETMEVGLLLLRLVVGLTVAAHGAQKAFGWFGGYGLEGTGGWLESLGFRPGHLHVRINAAAELVGGLLLAVGLLTPVAAAAIAGVMIVAVATVHRPNGFFNSAGGYEFNLVLASAAIALAFTGPGPLSLDNAMDLDLGGWTWGLAAIALAVLAATASLASRQTVPETAPTEDEQAGPVQEIDLRDTRERETAGRR